MQRSGHAPRNEAQAARGPRSHARAGVGSLARHRWRVLRQLELPEGGPLVGNIQINEYKAVDEHGKGNCVHAAIMIATPLVNVPAGRTLGWINIYKETGDAVKGDGEWTLDPPPERWIDQNNDEIKQPSEVSDTAPFYYGSGE